jgi:putative glutamine amidotransferase
VKWLLTETPGGDAINNYLLWLARFPVAVDRITPSVAIPRDIRGYDALLLTGGVDVNPACYHQPRAPKTVKVLDERDALELSLIKRFMASGVPVFGVCRGIQILNVERGGGLIQHIPHHLPERHGGHGTADAWHGLRFAGESRLASALAGVAEVNSAHHQAVDPAALGRGLRVTAVSGAGIVEAVEGVDLPAPVLAVQWHPERLESDHPASRNLLRLMVDLCAHGP